MIVAKKPSKKKTSGVPEIPAGAPLEKMKSGSGRSESFNYRTIVPLAAYIDRVGAEEMNFKRFMIKEYRGNYYTERVYIKIENGEVTCSNKEYAPTKDEAESIRIAMRAVEGSFPKCIQARNIDALRKKLGMQAVLFEFYDRKTGNIIMVQERRESEQFGKTYPPHTFWSDGIWRSMEPEQGLPFWKPKKGYQNVNRIMVHEGGKGAQFCDAMVNDHALYAELTKRYYGHEEKPEQHPWYEALRGFEHWGLIGGALAPHRANYSELLAEKPREVVYVCDNDYPGADVAQAFSEKYGRHLKALRFDTRFKYSFDLADPMPKDEYKNDKWHGPTLNEMLEPATFATELIPQDKGKPLIRLRRDWREEWLHCVKPEVFVHNEFSDNPLSRDEFNSKMRPYSHAKDTADLFICDAASKSATLKYSPCLESGIYSAEGGRFINTHKPSRIDPKKGDMSPFLGYMQELIPDEYDRNETLRWCATLIARPDIKMLYGLLMISSTQGVGKSTLGEKILAPLVGERNVSYPPETQITDATYNYWAAHKRLAVVHEIYAGHSSKAYNNLKTIITDRYITVSKKYQDQYEIENWIHIYACSNSMRALYLPNDDRRWFVPKVSEDIKPVKYWEELNLWLKEGDGLQIIKWWATEWLKKNDPVRHGAPAPMSKLKREIIEESLSSGQQIAVQVLDSIKTTLEGETEDDRLKREEWRSRGWLSDRGAFVLDTQIVDLIKNEVYDGRYNDRLERPGTIRKLARERGWFIGDHRAQVKEWITTLGRGAMGGKLIASTKELAEAMPVTLCGEKVDADKKVRPIDVKIVRGI